jgi:hypothetical protein
MLLTGSGDELCGMLSAQFQAVAYHPPTVGPSGFPVFVYWKFMEISSLPSPPSRVHSEHPTPCAVCSFSVLCLLFSFLFFWVFFARQWVSLPRGLCWFIPGVAVGILHAAYLLTCWSASPKQVWSWHLAAWWPSCCLSATWHGEPLYGLGIQEFDSSWWFFPAKGGSSISAKFLIYRAHAFCFCPLDTILDQAKKMLLLVSVHVKMKRICILLFLNRIYMNVYQIYILCYSGHCIHILPACFIKHWNSGLQDSN